MLNRKIPVTAAALGFTLLVTNASGALAANTSTTKAPATPAAQQVVPVVHTLANLQPVKISAKSTARLTDVNILTMDEESILTYTLTIANGDGKPLDLLDYWSKLKTASGTVYSTSLITQDKDKKKLSAGSSTTLTFVAKVGKNTKLSDLVFQVIKWDFSQSGYESLKGQFKIPETYQTSTPSNQSKTLKIFDVPVKAQVSHVATFTSGDYNYVNLGLKVQNIGYRIFQDPKAKFVIKADNGASYPLSADSTSIDFKIQPQDSKILNFMTNIPKTIDLKNMELQLVLDDETAKISLPIATMQLPKAANTSMAVEANEPKTISLDSGKIAVTVQGTSMSPMGDEQDLTVRFSIRNSSGTTLNLPKYQFEIHTSDGYRLPISAPFLEKVSLLPLEERMVTLNATIPANVKTDHLEMFMNLPAAADATPDSFGYPVGIFALPDAQSMQNMIGQKQFVQTTSGIVGYSLNSLQRLPWSDGDQFTAKITLYNPSNKTMKLPEFLGQLTIDSAKLDANTKLISTQNLGLLGAFMSADFYVVTKVPSYLDFNQVQVSLLEKIGESQVEWLQFSNSGILPKPSNIEAGAAYTIDTSGRKQELMVRRSYVYSGTSSDLIYTEIQTQNMESYPLNLSQLVGVYQGKGGETYKASASQIETSVGPYEKGIVALWAKIPKKTATEDMRLILGEGITNDKMTAIKEEPTGYINASAFELNVSQPNVNGTLSNLNLFPYTLTVKDVRATLSGSTSVNLIFDYNQSRDMDYAIGEFGHKYLFEVVDSSGRTFEKEFAPETELRLTSDGSASFSFDDFVFDGRKGGTFTLNVYDLFQGQKVKLGNQGYYYISQSIESIESIE